MASECDLPGPLELLVLQPTPFCNINCSYCYLPDRQSTKQMSPQTLEQTFEWVFSSGLVREPFVLLWHAGEPLVVPPAFYEQAIALLERYNLPKVEVYHALQTNATLIDSDWCRFFVNHDIHPGVSVDGPDFLHDRHRRTRQGKGTLDRVLRGIRLLQEHEVPFYVITVLTAESLNYPDELFDFYLEQQIRSVAFNVEEIEGPHTTSSLLGVQMRERFLRFFARFMDLALAADPPLPVREYETSAGALLGPRYGAGSRTQENKPWAIVNVDCEGNLGTYSPELLGMSSPRHGSFALGNVATDSLETILASPRFRFLEEEISTGVEKCRQTCPYFAFCGGGPPANKFFETGTFATTETLFCRLHKQVCLDVTLAILEQRKPDPFPEPARQETTRCLSRFIVPGHLRSAFWDLLARSPRPGEIPADGFSAFVADIGRFLAFKQLPAPRGAIFDLVVNQPGLGTRLAESSLWGLINLGEDAASVVFVQVPERDVPSVDNPRVRLQMAPSEGVRLPAGMILGNDGVEQQQPEVLLLIRLPSG